MLAQLFQRLDHILYLISSLADGSDGLLGFADDLFCTGQVCLHFFNRSGATVQLAVQLVFECLCSCFFGFMLPQLNHV